MPTTYQFQPLPLSNEKEFEYFIQDLFDELNPELHFELYGEGGDDQEGIDVISFEQNIAIQCKKRELSKSKKNDEARLSDHFKKDLKRAVESDIQVDKFIFATTYRNTPNLQKLAGKLAKEFGIRVEYWGWGTITEKLHQCENTRRKYYSQLIPEIDHFTEDDFIKSVKGNHFVDQLYKSLKRFDGFRFIEPKKLTRLYPIKSTNEYDSTGFQFGCLRTDNIGFKEFFELLKKKGDSLEPNMSVLRKKKINIDNVEEKIKFILDSLKTSSVNCINTPDGNHNKILKRIHNNCSCGACLWENLKFEELGTPFTGDPADYPNGPLSMAFGLYKLRQFDKSREIIEASSKEEINPVKLFITRYNQYWLNRLSEEDGIENIDLDYELTKIEIQDAPVREALIELKEQKLFNIAYKKIDQYIEKIEEIYSKYKKENFSTTGPNFVWLMNDVYFDLYKYYRHNYLVLDIYQDFEALSLKAFKGWLLSYLTSKKYGNRLEQFHILPVATAIFYVSGKDLQKLFNEYNVDIIQFHPETSKYLNRLASNFLGSVISSKESNYYHNLIRNQGIGGRHRKYFQSIILLLAYGGTQKAPKNLFDTLISIVSQEHVFYSSDISYVGELFDKKGNWFTWRQHDDFIKSILANKSLRSSGLIKSVANSRKVNYPKVKFNNEAIIKDILNLVKDNKDYSDSLITLLKISDENLSNIICIEIKAYFNAKFNLSLYRAILISGMYPDICNDFLIDYVKYVNSNKGCSIGKDRNGYERVTNFEFLNFVSSLVIKFQTRDKFPNEIRTELTDLDLYQSWLIDPDNYNYENFNRDWIKYSDIDIVLKYLGRSNKLMKKLLQSLKENFDERIAVLYARML